MANKGRAEEALPYYYRALELNPAYIRARSVPALAHSLVTQTLTTTPPIQIQSWHILYQSPRKYIFLSRYTRFPDCCCLQRYEEAASHILDALVLQDSDGVADETGMNDKRGVTSSTLWDSLKTTCLHLQRVDLASLCDSRDLDGKSCPYHSFF
jgi:peroxin-5